MKASLLAILSLITVSACVAAPARRPRKAVAPSRAPFSSLGQSTSSTSHLAVTTPASHIIEAADTQEGGHDSLSIKSIKSNGGQQFKSIMDIDLNQEPEISHSSSTEQMQEVRPVTSEQSMTPFALERQRRRNFFIEWDKLNINYNKPPDAALLAEMIRSIQIPGMKRPAIGLFAANHIRNKFPESYSDDYFRRVKKLSSAQKILRTKERKKQGIPPRLISSSSYGKPRRNEEEKKLRFEKSKQKLDLLSERMQRDRQRVIDAIESRGWWKLPIDKLEEATRNFSLKDATKFYCTAVIRQHLEDLNRKLDAERFPQIRKNAQAKLRYRKKQKATKEVVEE